MKFKVALSTISQRFEYHTCIKKFFPLANVYDIALSIRSVIESTVLDYIIYGRLFQNLDVVAMATISVFLGFSTVNFLCSRGDRVNIQGVSTGEATRKSVHKFGRNSQFLCLM